nr:hypothetical protein [Veillonella sp.]
MTQYVLVAALPIILTAELVGTALDAGLAMTYFQSGPSYVVLLQDV